MCEGVTAEELLNPMQEAQEQPGSNQTMKFTYKRRLFASPNKVQELIVPASIRAVKVNRFSTGSLQVYCADERGNIRLWDLAKVQERSLLESSRSCSPRPGHEDLRLSSETEEEPSPRHGRATISAKFRRGVMANRRRTFLTQPTPEWPSETDDEHHDLSAMRKRRDGTKVTRPKKRFLEVTLLHESSGHDDAVLSLDLCEAGTTPEAVATEDKSGRAEYHRRWILSVGADRVVKAWSLDLKRLGQLTSDATRCWTPLGSSSIERRRSFLRAAGLNLTALRQRLAEKLPRKENDSSSDATDIDENIPDAPIHCPELRARRAVSSTAAAQLAAFHLKTWPRRRNPLTSSQIEAATKFEQLLDELLGA